MSRALVLTLGFAGCGFRIEGGGQFVDDAHRDSNTSTGDGAIDAPIDAPIDSPIDAPVPVTTDHASVADTFISADTANSNYGGQTSALADGGPVRNALYKFDLSTLPASTMITAVDLYIWTDDDDGGTVTFHEVLQDWTEGNATWNNRIANTTWATAGAEPPSRGTATVGTVMPSQTFTGYVVPIDITLVQKWANTPATNFGLLLRTTDSNGARFVTKENGTTSRRPYLRITHAP
ncbi:MAG: DNRLRE domain-containing protein [Kofleriaceae bacterium]|nr:DNRLRE domain-containing protein [Kofleriaceae bacterium]